MEQGLVEIALHWEGRFNVDISIAWFGAGTAIELVKERAFKKGTAMYQYDKLFASLKCNVKLLRATNKP